MGQALRTLHIVHKISTVDHATWILKISFLKFPTTCILNSSLFSLDVCLPEEFNLQQYSCNQYLDAEKQNEHISTLRWSFNTELALLWKSYANEVCDLLYIHFDKWNKKYQNYIHLHQ